MTVIRLAQLRLEQPGLLQDVANGNRVLWVGSGISRGIVPMLPELIHKIFTFLQSEAHDGNLSDPHLAALNELVSKYLPAELDDFRASPRTWPIPEVESFAGLTNYYSDIFATRVQGKQPDYVFLTAADIVRTFSDSTLAPGVNHNLLALLILEGVVTEVASGNWDGLIESAVASLAGHQECHLAVMMTNDSFRGATGPARLYKFHGCAILANKAPGQFTSYLVGRANDIAGWASETRYREVSDRMKSLARNQPTLFLGLSVQDYNLMLTLISSGIISPWEWDPQHPAYLFSELTLSSGQAGLLEKVYPSQYNDSATEIDDRSTLKMYSDEILASLAIHILSEKFRALSARSTIFPPEPSRLRYISDGTKGLEDEILRGGADPESLFATLSISMSAITRRFLGGIVPDAYSPLFFGHADNASIFQGPIRDRTTELSAILTVLGLGSQRGRWELKFLTGANEECGFVEIRSSESGNGVRLVTVRDEAAANEVMKLRTWTSATTPTRILHLSGSAGDALTRSSSRGLGAGRRRPATDVVWLDDTLRGTTGSAAVLENFAEAIGI